MRAPTKTQLLDIIGGVIFSAFEVAEDTEDASDEHDVRTSRAAMNRLNDSFDRLEGWPDEPGTICGPAAKAQWALKSHIAALEAQLAEAVEALEEVKNLPDVDADQCGGIARRALAKIKGAQG